MNDSESEPKNSAIVETSASPLAQPPDEPPVVARLVIEIRSDGTRTIARGAMEDALNGQKVAIEADGGTPMELAASLMKSLLTMPMMTAKSGRSGAVAAIRALIGRKK